jgi:hypothetical protein
MSCPLQKGMSQKSEIKKIDAWLHPIIATTNLQVVLKMSYGCEQIENRIDWKQHRKSAVQQRRIAADSSAPSESSNGTNWVIRPIRRKLVSNEDASTWVTGPPLFPGKAGQTMMVFERTVPTCNQPLAK